MSVLLYSSGLDSELYRLLEEPELLLTFKSGARYEKFEIEQINHLRACGKITEDLVVDETLNFASLEDNNLVVPMRNIFYILRALEYGNEVLLGVSSYDMHYDKQPDVLNALAGFVQNYYYFREVPETWESVHPRVLTPYRDWSKGQMLREAIERGTDVSHIPTLRTCYSSTSKKGCGKCKSCLHKAMALAVNGMFRPELFDEDPRVFCKGRLPSILEDENVQNTIDVELFREEATILLES